MPTSLDTTVAVFIILVISLSLLLHCCPICHSPCSASLLSKQSNNSSSPNQSIPVFIPLVNLPFHPIFVSTYSHVLTVNSSRTSSIAVLIFTTITKPNVTLFACLPTTPLHGLLQTVRVASSTCTLTIFVPEQCRMMTFIPVYTFSLLFLSCSTSTPTHSFICVSICVSICTNRHRVV